MPPPENTHYSIIIPCLNEEENLTELLPLLKKYLSNSAYEVIVVDGGSTDNSREICLKHGIRFVASARGRSIQLNAGAKGAIGEYLYFLHADTRPPGDLLDWFEKIRITQLSSACFQLKFDYQHPFLKLMGWFTRFDLNCFRFGDQSLLVAADQFGRTGGYDETMQLMEGNDLIVRLKSRGDFSVLDAFVTTSARKYRKHGVVYLQLLYILIYLLGQMGINQDKLVEIYKWGAKE